MFKVVTPDDVTDIVPVFLLLTLNTFYAFSSVFIVDFEQLNVSWETGLLLPPIF